MARKPSPDRLLAFFTDTFGLGRGGSICFLLLIAGFLLFLGYLFARLKPPTHLTITAGPPGSLFETNAQKYATILARNGVKLRILTSHGSLENLNRLHNPKSRVDIGFVQGGLTNALGSEPVGLTNATSSGQRGSDNRAAASPGGPTNALPTAQLFSLGSVFYEPLFIFYRAETNFTLLSEFAGKRLSIGPLGSGTRALTQTLLATNGVSAGGATELLTMESEAAAKELLDGRIDAVFFMADSASSQVTRQLLRTPGIRIFDVKQANGYTRRFRYLNQLEIPMGTLDFGRNIPPQDIHLIGPTVELVARPDLHPALSDLLLEAAQEVHGNATLLQRQGEFPSPVEHEFRISPDAQRYYKTGKSMLYRSLPFWLAALLNGILIVFVPLIVVLIPAFRFIPTLYRWRIRLRINRWYRALLALETDLSEHTTVEKREALLLRLNQIESAVSKLKLPASFGDQFYGLRGHITFVRDRLTANSKVQSN
ncbi:MAG: C4-dicarboxylate ABC transporter substrate-binding protein [Proteobacteria bacterium]|nr:C4-dicarboxylate ABC transporter substrate-binding protein [Pseudomonadota bacterium]